MGAISHQLPQSFDVTGLTGSDGLLEQSEERRTRSFLSCAAFPASGSRLDPADAALNHLPDALAGQTKVLTDPLESQRLAARQAEAEIENQEIAAGQRLLGGPREVLDVLVFH
jgi:hypothetical protein